MLTARQIKSWSAVCMFGSVFEKMEASFDRCQRLEALVCGGGATPQPSEAIRHPLVLASQRQAILKISRTLDNAINSHERYELYPNKC
jgi:hypothetical protein